MNTKSFMCTLKQSQTPDCNVPEYPDFGAGLIDLLVILGVTQRPDYRRSALNMTCLDAPQPTSAPRRNNWSVQPLAEEESLVDHEDRSRHALHDHQDLQEQPQSLAECRYIRRRRARDQAG